MTQSLSERDIRAWLDWMGEAGIGDFVSDRPANWFEHARQQLLARSAIEPVAPSVKPASRGPAPQWPERQERAAPPPRALPQPLQRPAKAQGGAGLQSRNEAKAAQTLAELLGMLQRFEGCALKATAKSLCFYRGAEKARLMLIGEAPGRDEDLQGRPFVGRAGQLLDRMLGSIGLTESNVHITNIVYWRPPGNRTPTPQEAESCWPFLERQIELVAPDLVLILGGAAAKQLLDTTDGIMRLRGKWRSLRIGEKELKVLATLHPAYLLRTPAQKRLAWRDLLMVEEALRKSKT